MNAPYLHLDRIADALAVHARDLLSVDTRIRSLHARLADTPGGEPKAWKKLTKLQGKRERLELLASRAYLEWLYAGGSIELLDPDVPEPDTSHQATPPPREKPASPERGEDEPVALPDVAPPPSSVAPVAPAVDAPPPTVASTPVPRVTPSALEKEPAVALDAPGPEPVVVDDEPTPSTAAVLVSRPDAPVVEPPAPSPRATADELLAFKNTFGKRAEAAPRAARPSVLDFPLDRPLDTTDLGTLDAHIAQLHHTPWSAVAGVHRHLHILVYRLKALQERAGSESVGHTIQSIHHLNKDRSFGYIYGLRLDDEPRYTADWDAEADHALTEGLEPTKPKTNPDHTIQCFLKLDLQTKPIDEIVAHLDVVFKAGVAHDDPRLVNALLDRYNELKGHAKLKRLRNAIKKQLQRSKSKARKQEGPARDWPLWHLTRGRSVVIIGGDSRPKVRDRIKNAFGFASVEWPENDAKMQARVAERLKHGTVDLVLINRYGGHDIDKTVLAAVRDDLTRWVRMDRGYGVSEVQRAMEAQWRGFTGETSAAS